MMGIGEPRVSLIAATAVALSLVVTMLDATDGWMARRSRMASDFGATFDMEVDALLIIAKDRTPAMRDSRLALLDHPKLAQTPALRQNPACTLDLSRFFGSELREQIFLAAFVDDGIQASLPCM